MEPTDLLADTQQWLAQSGNWKGLTLELQLLSR